MAPTVERLWKSVEFLFDPTTADCVLSSATGLEIHLRVRVGGCQIFAGMPFELKSNMRFFWNLIFLHEFCFQKYR